MISAGLLEIHQVLKRIENLWYIADTCNSTPRTGIDDITSFFGPSKLLVCWRYLKINQDTNQWAKAPIWCIRKYYSISILRLNVSLTISDVLSELLPFFKTPPSILMANYSHVLNIELNGGLSTLLLTAVNTRISPWRHPLHFPEHQGGR